jgi:O-methyltransferase involved in polyketide biosynthesis
METTNNVSEYSKISPTAKITAYWKSLSDIPYAKEISDTINAEKGAKEVLGDNLSVMEHFSSVIMEVRYKAINAGLQKKQVNNIMELACGLSPRGLELVANNKKYIGTDLPDMLAETSSAVNTIAARIGIKPGLLHFEAVNVLDKEQLEKAAVHFNGERFAICNEGLLMYFNMEEKAAMAKNVHSVLHQNGGCWITIDIAFSELRKKLFAAASPEAKEKLKGRIGTISNQTGRDLATNDFKDETEATAFYEALGFHIEKYPFYDGSYEISTLHLIPQEMRETVVNALSNTMAWILEPIA